MGLLRASARACPPAVRAVETSAVSSLLFLGTGPGAPVRGKFFSSCLLRTANASVLVDAGEPCSQRLVELGVSCAEIDAVLLTHGHSDHTAGLPMLLQSAWLAPRMKPLTICLPQELIAPLQSWLRAVYLPPELLGFPLEFRPWAAGREFSLAEGLDVSPFPTTHLQSLQQIIEPAAVDRFEIFGLSMNCSSQRVVFSSDLGAPDDLASALEEPCDVLVCELSHFTPEELFAFLRPRAIDLLVLNHLGTQHAGREEEIAAAARAALPDIREVVVPRDGALIEF